MMFMTLSDRVVRGGFFVEKFGSAQIAGGRYYEHPPQQRVQPDRRQRDAQAERADQQ
jgi:hypothetical protein